MRKRSGFVIGCVMFIGFGITACGDTDGVAVPDPASSATGASNSPGQKAPLAGTDPCSLLTQEQKIELQVERTKNDDVAGTKSCVMDIVIPHDTAIGGIDILNDRGLDQYNDLNAPTEKTTVSGRNALTQRDNLGACVYALEVTEASRVDIQASVVNDMDASCQLSKKIAELVAQNLP